MSPSLTLFTLLFYFSLLSCVSSSLLQSERNEVDLSADKTSQFLKMILLHQECNKGDYFSPFPRPKFIKDSENEKFVEFATLSMHNRSKHSYLLSFPEKLQRAYTHRHTHTHIHTRERSSGNHPGDHPISSRGLSHSLSSSSSSVPSSQRQRRRRHPLRASSASRAIDPRAFRPT